MTDQKPLSGAVLIRLIICFMILGVGVAGFALLKHLKKPPAQVEPTERPLPVRARQVAPQKVSVRISGLGEIRSRTVVSLSAEVAGRITSVHTRLDPGEIIKKGEVLVTIDERDYRLDYETAQARLKILRRDHELAVKELNRVRTLYQKKRVGALSSVEKAETTANTTADRISQVEQALRLAQLRIERCTLRALFDCRIAELDVEQDEYVTPGKKLLTLVDDADLEMVVSLDSRDVLNWLQFDGKTANEEGSWFGKPKPVICRIFWTENTKVRGQGHLDRVVRFDPKTRTVLAAVHLDPNPGAVFPLVEGMFCRVSIPGRSLAAAFVLPRRAVSFENTVYVAVKGRLRTKTVTVAQADEDRAIITGGLEAGDIVITTRLEQPLENSLLDVTLEDAEGQ